MENEQIMSAEEKLKELDAERKTLRTQVKDERTIRLEEAAEMRIMRDKTIEETQGKLKKISAKIYQYNKLGKVSKIEFDILGIIQKEISTQN